MLRIVLAVLIAAMEVGVATAQTAAGSDMRAAPQPRAAMMALPATREQAKAVANAHFAAMDRNHDGVVTRDELLAALPSRNAAPDGALPPMLDAMFDRMDVDRDGKVSAAEAERFALHRFDLADTDHDGKLSDAERAAARPKGMMNHVQRGGAATQ